MFKGSVECVKYKSSHNNSVASYIVVSNAEISVGRCTYRKKNARNIELLALGRQSANTDRARECPLDRKKGADPVDNFRRDYL